ncbi:hypothetical protein [Myxacorys almedinensis]|uniref:Uncharacterized protein n=1 Tax=Myxacorys almedinensis A TaxID=2690445 RepID=A0A8J7Z079_9CYAN|nr:hypothetical protein [Myxacorys almedinensis]NDJ16660.1 hypothetical protein [Myxacorys almedinensis A]
MSTNLLPASSVFPKFETSPWADNLLEWMKWTAFCPRRLVQQTVLQQNLCLMLSPIA